MRVTPGCVGRKSRFDSVSSKGGGGGRLPGVPEEEESRPPSSGKSNDTAVRKHDKREPSPLPLTSKEDQMKEMVKETNKNRNI